MIYIDGYCNRNKKSYNKIKKHFNFLCFIGIHKWTKWKFKKEISSFEDHLKRKCKRCKKIDNYKGPTEVCMVTGNLSPYGFKD